MRIGRNIRSWLRVLILRKKNRRQDRRCYGFVTGALQDREAGILWVSGIFEGSAAQDEDAAAVAADLFLMRAGVAEVFAGHAWLFSQAGELW